MAPIPTPEIPDRPVRDSDSAEGARVVDTAGLAGIELQADRVEVRLSRARARARLFGRRDHATQLGRFVVLERVGSGGMGVVYKAYDPQLDRRVALKVLRTDVVRRRWPALQAQLVQEARAMARLSHPNVVTVFEVGTQGDEVFVAMEFVEASTLRAWLSTPGRTVDEVVDVFIEAGAGLAAAHGAGLVHRDFKPDNVLVPEDGPVRVTDFGLARVLDRSAARSGLHPIETGPGLSASTVAGTPAYMAPEQTEGGTIDARTDQFAFCVALYEALGGQRPASPPAPIERDGLSRRRADAILRGLASAPTQRHPSMEALLDALRPPPRRGWRTIMAGAVLVGVTGAAVGALLMAEPECPAATERMAGVWDLGVRDTTHRAFEATERSYAGTAWPQVRDRLDRYRDAWLQGRQRACKATTTGEQSDAALDLRSACLERQRESLLALTTLLQSVDASGLEHAVESTMALPSPTMCDDVLTLREHEHPPSPVQAPVAQALGGTLARARAQFTLARYDEAREGLAQLVNDARELDYEPLVARVLHLRAQLLAATAETDAALVSYDEALGLAGALRDTPLAAEVALDRLDAVVGRVGHNDRAVAIADATEVLLAAIGAEPVARGRLRLAQGRLAYRMGDYEQGLAATREALELTRDGSDAEQVLVADVLQQIGTLLYTQGHLEQAHEHGDSALALRQRLLGPDHPRVAQSLANLGAIALARRDVESAHALFQRAAQIQRAALGDHHPALARTLSNLCSSSHEAGQYERALQECGESVGVGEAAYGPDDPSLGMLLVNLGSVQQQAGQRARARATYQRAEPLLQRALGSDHPHFATLLANLGRLHASALDYAQAQRHFERAVAIRDKGFGPDHRSTLRVRYELAETLLHRGETQRAESELRAVQQRLRATLGDDHVDLAGPLSALAELAIAVGERDTALEYLERAVVLLAKPPVRKEDLAVAHAKLARVLGSDAEQQVRASELACSARPDLPQTDEMADLRRWAAARCEATPTSRRPHQ